MSDTREMIEAMERNICKRFGSVMVNGSLAPAATAETCAELASIRASLPDVERAVRIIEEVRDRSDVPAVCACRLDEAVFRLRTPAVAYSYTPTITGSSEPMFDVAMSPDGETFKVAERAPAVASAPDADVAWDA